MKQKFSTVQKKQKKTIVLPEAFGCDDVVKAGIMCAENKIAKVVLLVEDDSVQKRFKIVENEYLKQTMYNYFLNISINNENIYFRKANYSRIRAKLAADQFLEEHKDYNREHNRM